MRQPGKETPRRPFKVGAENDNANADFDKDHVTNEPSSDAFVDTGERSLHEDESLERDVADEPE
jgi:hypothetical protein